MREILWSGPAASVSETFSVREASGFLIFSPTVEGAVPSIGLEVQAPDSHWIPFDLQGLGQNETMRSGLIPGCFRIFDCGLQLRARWDGAGPPGRVWIND